MNNLSSAAILAAIAGNYIAVIGLYIYAFKSRQEIIDMVYKHETESDKHVKSEALVYRDVCKLQVKRFEERIDEVKSEVQGLKSDIDGIKSDISTGFSEVKTLIKAQK